MPKRFFHLGLTQASKLVKKLYTLSQSCHTFRSTTKHLLRTQNHWVGMTADYRSNHSKQIFNMPISTDTQNQGQTRIQSHHSRYQCLFQIIVTTWINNNRHTKWVRLTRGIKILVEHHRLVCSNYQLQQTAVESQEVRCRYKTRCCDEVNQSSIMSDVQKLC